MAAAIQNFAAALRHHVTLGQFGVGVAIVAAIPNHTAAIPNFTAARRRGVVAP